MFRMLVLGLVAAMLVPVVPAAAQQSDDPELSVRDRLVALGKQFTPKQDPGAAVARGAKAPKGANPWLSLLPPDELDKVDYAYWRQVAEARSAQEARSPERRSAFDADDELLIDDKEPDGIRGSNDTQATAQFIRGLGTGSDDAQQARILGTLAPTPPATPIGPFDEDDGAIPLANPTGLDSGEVVVADGDIGDGPHGSDGDATGDFDHYALPGLAAGDDIVVDIDTPDPSTLDSTVVIYDAAGIPVAFNDDDGTSLDSLLSFTVPADGDYVAAVEGFGTFQQDPFDSGSGIGVGSEGAYTVEIGRNASDADFYRVDLEPGDVVSAKVEDGASNLRLFAPDGTEVVGSSQDASFIYPLDTKLTGGGNAVLDHVAEDAGQYALRISQGEGNYEGTLRVVRPGFEDSAAQTLFLDFDGEELNTAVFGGSGVTQLSPFSAFLGRWGLTPDDEDAVIDAVLAEVRENLRRDLRRQGTNPEVRVRIRNSRDHADRFGRRNVSRVVVGGTIAESGVPTIGIAQSIDPGNYDGEDTALVLLDVLSDPAAEFGDPSLNTYLTDESDAIAFVGQAVGNVVSHEIGHFVGSWHVDQFNDQPNLMDQGGNFPVLYGVGPDGVGGTADDDDVDFGEDRFNPAEGFTGLENTLNRSAWAF